MSKYDLEHYFDRPTPCFCDGIWIFMPDKAEYLRGIWECAQCGMEVKTKRRHEMHGNLEIHVPSTIKHQADLRKKGYRFCDKCGKAHTSPITGMPFTGQIDVTCPCGGTATFEGTK